MQVMAIGTLGMCYCNPKVFTGAVTPTPGFLLARVPDAPLDDGHASRLVVGQGLLPVQAS